MAQYPEETMRSLKHLIPLLRPFRSQVFLTTVGLIGLTAIELILPTIIRQVIDVGLAGSDSTFLIQAALALLGLGILRSVLAYGQRYIGEWISHHVAYNLRNKQFSRSHPKRPANKPDNRGRPISSEIHWTRNRRTRQSPYVVCWDRHHSVNR
jgi:ABC-type bacteriocin/lantibiotic exporter with double-glycine peptidase domain